MNKTTRSIIVLLAMTASLTSRADTGGYLEMSAVLRGHDYGLDLTIDNTRYHIDETFRSGWAAEAGWSFSDNWTVMLSYVKHDTDNADGIIISPVQRVQAPIFYEFQRGAIGIQNHWAIADKWWLDTTVSYQRTEQGIGNFYIESGDFAFGLEKVERDSAAAAELALRTVRGNWELELIAGYDPHAGFEIAAADIDVESSAYGGVGVDYVIGDRLTLGVDARSGKVTDVAFTLGVRF